MRTRVLAPLLLLAAVPPANATQAPATTPATVAVRDPDLADRARIATVLYHAIRRYFAHAEALPADYDFEEAFRLYLRDALGAADRRAFTLATMRLFAGLRNGHTSFYDDRLGPDGPPPFAIRRVEGRWTVLSSRVAGLRPGDIVATADGRPADEWLRPVRALINASDASALDRLSWARTGLLPARFTLGLSDGRTVPVDLTAAVPAPPGPPRRVEVLRRASGVVVIRVPSFAEPVFEDDAVRAVRAAGGARAILIDLRGNGGGTTPERLLAAVMTRPYRGTSFVTPSGTALEAARASFAGGAPVLPDRMTRYAAVATRPLVDAWAGRMAVLVDGGCASACEDFVLRFRDGARGAVLGERTFGSTGQPYYQAFAGLGLSFRVSTKREYFPDGGQFEGVGVAPDRPVPLTRAELRRGTDDQLATAERLVLEGVPR